MSSPCAWRSPKNDSFRPPKWKNGIGAAVPTFTPRFPIAASWRNRRASAPRPVKRLAALPKRLSFSRSIAASTSATGASPSTGPNTSSRAISISAVTPPNTVGPRKFPFS